jgi:hypothetical protein
MRTLVLFIAAGAGIFFFAMGIQWLLWCLYCWVMPQVWASGPQNIIAPSFWLFWAMTFLLSIFGKLLFKSSKE